MRKTTPLDSPVSLGILRARGFALLAALAAVLVATLGGAQMLRAQAPATPLPSTKSVPAHKPAHPHKRPVAVKAQSPATPAATPTKPPEPEAPKWPANEKATPATVTWDSQGLRIDAVNSSLAQILQDVSTATGTKVEGFEADQRVFGAYGPGPARDVLSQLLQGSGYNFVMIGEQGQGTPRQLVLSPHHAGPATKDVKPSPASVREEEADTEEQPQPVSPPIRPGVIPGEPPRTPQQMQRRPQPGQPQPQPPSNPQN
jgi:hypothetical protein